MLIQVSVTTRSLPATAALGSRTISQRERGCLPRRHSVHSRDPHWRQLCRSVSRLARACPGVPVLLVAVTGGTDLKRFPKRPRVTVEFFEPAGGQPRPDEDDQELAQRLLDEIRAKAPRTK